MLADAVDVGAPGKKFRRHSVPSRIARPIRAAARYLASQRSHAKFVWIMSREVCIDAALRTCDSSSCALPGSGEPGSISQPSTVPSLRAAAIGPDIVPALAEIEARPSARGKFVFVGDDKLYVRGVPYGTFRPDEDGSRISRQRNRRAGLHPHGGMRRERGPRLHGAAA